MYCQTCGAEIQPGLNYCSRCGAQIAVAPAQRELPAPMDITSPTRWLAATICLTMLIGFGMLLITLVGLANLGIHGDPLVAITFFGLIAIFFTEFMLIRMMSRLLITAKDEGRLSGAKQRGGKQLGAPAPQQFIQPPTYAEPLTSVTEHTTKTLGQTYRAPHAEK